MDVNTHWEKDWNHWAKAHTWFPEQQPRHPHQYAGKSGQPLCCPQTQAGGGTIPASPEHLVPLQPHTTLKKALQKLQGGGVAVVSK